MAHSIRSYYCYCYYYCYYHCRCCSYRNCGPGYGSEFRQIFFFFFNDTQNTCLPNDVGVSGRIVFRFGGWWVDKGWRGRREVTLDVVSNIITSRKLSSLHGARRFIRTRISISPCQIVIISEQKICFNVIINYN